MPTITGLDALPENVIASIITLGNFDGVHLGHQALFKLLIERAAELQGKSLVVTFDPHPLKLLKPEIAPEIITPLTLKADLILDYGINFVLVIPFTHEFARISADRFIDEILCKKLKMRHLVVGYDYSFGKNREGNIDLLEKMGKTLGYSMDVLTAIRKNDTLVSSTSIRNLIREGNVAKVAELLGRPFQLRGRIVEGRHVGGPLLGFPTANLDTSEMGIIPAMGVYAVQAILDDETIPGVCNIGVNPTFGELQLTVEVHLFDFSRTIYCQSLKVNFIERLREEKKFADLRALTDQIREDADKARRILHLSR